MLSKLLFWLSSGLFSWLLCSFSLFVLSIFSSTLSTVSKFDKTSLYELSSISASSLSVIRSLIWSIFLESLKEKFGAFSAVSPILLLPLLSSISIPWVILHAWTRAKTLPCLTKICLPSCPMTLPGACHWLLFSLLCYTKSPVK